MVLLLALTHPQLAEVYAPGLGRLVGPRLRTQTAATAAADWPWAADNDAYSDWNARRFRAMLKLLHGLPGCAFVTSPDVVGDHDATLERFGYWQPVIARHELPVAFVAQDGVTPDAVPWEACAALFLGGSDAFKLGPAARAVAAEAKTRGHWLHMGRVNSYRRMRYAHALGCDSIDGTKWARWNAAHLADGVRWLNATVDQQHMELV